MIDKLFKECRDKSEEKCGYIIKFHSTSEPVYGVYPCKNSSKKDKKYHFEIDWADTFSAQEVGEIVACYHSHTTENIDFTERDKMSSKNHFMSFILVCEKIGKLRFFDPRTEETKTIDNIEELETCLKG